MIQNTFYIRELTDFALTGFDIHLTDEAHRQALSSH